MEKEVRTRFAPSPTGYMHIGNLRTALYAYLFAKHYDGKFILRIEDTDQKRFVEGATDLIYHTLKETRLVHDEGPDIGGKYGPYVQSERKPIYKKYAEELVKNGHAYYCFCGNEEHEHEEGEPVQFGYNRHCRNLSTEEVEAKLNSGVPYVIRQKVPLEGTTTFHDEVFGDITVENNTLDDQILLKSDGLPTYNFANVVDDHLMEISHVIRGKEYLSSTPKYQLLYEAFGWEPPKTLHLSTIMGQNPDGTVSKLSKRHGAVSFAQLVQDGYLAEAILNYIALLGWSSKTEEEIFSLDELIKLFTIDGIVKTDAVFDYKKLKWMNSIYIKNLSHEEFLEKSKNFISELPEFVKDKWDYVSTLVQTRIDILSDIPKVLHFFSEYGDFDLNLLENKKNKITLENALPLMEDVALKLEGIEDWSVQALNEFFASYSEEHGYKLGFVMWPFRIAVTGETVTPGGTSEMMFILGKSESLKRINHTIKRLK